MASLEKIRMTKTKQREILRQIMKNIFAPRVQEIRRVREAFVDRVQRRHDPKFFELYSDESIRPYLDYSTASTLVVRPPFNSRGKAITLTEDQQYYTGYTVRTPSFFNDMKDCLNDIGIHAHDPESGSSYDRPQAISTMAHNSGSIELTQAECKEYWAFREEDTKVQKAFDTLKTTLQTALAAARYIKDFYADYPQFSHLSDEPAEIFPDAPLPAPTASTLVNMVEGMGLHIPSPLETKEARDGSE